MNIKCITYSRYSTSIPIYTLIQQKSNSALESDAQKMSSKIKSLKSKIGQRDKLRTAYGVWFVTRDENDISYGVCTDQSYPERHAYGLIQKIKDKIQEINHCEYQTEQNIKAYTKKTTNQLAKQYNDLSKVDKVYQAANEVKSLENQLGDGIKKLINNQTTLEEMGDKAQKMKGFAADFHTNSQTLERMMYWRNVKLKIIVALCIIGLVGFIVLIIVLKVKAASQ